MAKDKLVQEIFVGVDGGGTKSFVQVMDAKGNLLGEAMGGPGNIRLSVEQTWFAINHALEKILSAKQISLSDPDYCFHAGMGLAGCETKEAYAKFLQTPHPFTTLKVVSDAHIACLGAHQGDGAIIIVGTGVVGYQIQAGINSRASGWGFPHDDEGGGAWLGLEAVRLTLKWLDQRSEGSILLQGIYDYFSQDMNKLVSWANKATSTDFAELAPLIIQYSKQNDRWAVNLLQRAANAIHEVANSLVKQQINSSVLPCCLMGGIAPFLVPYLPDDLTQRLVPPKTSACQGALVMIKEVVNKKDFA